MKTHLTNSIKVILSIMLLHYGFSLSAQNCHPTWNRTYSKPCIFTPIQFEANFPGYTSYSWDYGDGMASGLGTSMPFRHPVHAFSGEGMYTVVLEAKGPGGTCKDTLNITISDCIDSCYRVILRVDSLRYKFCSDSFAYVYAHTINANHPVNYEWSTVPPIKNSIAKFKSPGIYSLTIKDAFGCTRKTTLLVPDPIMSSDFDLDINLISEIYRPGRKTLLTPIGINNRCQPVNEKLSIVLSKIVSYETASPGPDKISGDTLTWFFSKQTYGSEIVKPAIYVTTNVNSKIGDSVCFNVSISPASGDANISNNEKRYCYPVRNSYDPNIKSVFPQGKCKQNYVLKDKPLTYTVQFQNTGNAEAIDIFILDTLDKNLDINSLRVIGQSHQAPITEILNGNVIKFRFDNINLPDSSSNEKESHGYVIFEIKPKSTAANGAIVTGKAGIYFDYNQPVFTNEIKNTLVNSIPFCELGVSSVTNMNSIYIYPNPNTGKFVIEVPTEGKNNIEIINQFGQVVFRDVLTGSANEMDIDLSNGVYTVRIVNEGISINKKIVVWNRN
jgi:PKD repeat protein